MGTWRHTNVTTATVKTSSVLHGSVAIAKRKPCELDTLTFRAKAEVADEGDEWLVEYAEDNSTFVTVFAGDISVKGDDQWEGDTPYWDFTARDFTARLEDTIITTNREVTESTEDRAIWIMAQGNDFDITDGGIAAIATTVGPAKTKGLNKRQALAQLAGQVPVVFYVADDKELQLYEYDTVIAAPFDLSTAPDFVTTYPIAAFHRDTDVTDQADAVWAQGDDVEVWVPDVPTAGQKARAIQAAGTGSETALTAIGTAELIRIETAQVGGTVTTFKPGLESGQTVNIEHASHSIDAPYIINGITITPFANPPGGTDYDASYNIAFSDRLLCIPQMDGTRDTGGTKPDCSDCREVVTILPDGMDENLSLARGQAGMHVYDNTSLAAFDCALAQARYVASAPADLDAIYHEPSIYTGLFAGDRVFHLDSDLGPYGTPRWTTADTIIAGAVTDERKAWDVLGGTAFEDLFTRSTSSPTVDNGWMGPTDGGATPFVSNGTLLVDGDELVYTGSNSSGEFETTQQGDGPWNVGTDMTMLALFKITWSGNAARLFVFGRGGDDEVAHVEVKKRAADGDYDFVLATDDDTQTMQKTLVSGTQYYVRWQHLPTQGISRARLWAAAGSEPSTWDLEATTTDESTLIPGFEEFSLYGSAQQTIAISSVVISSYALEVRSLVDGSVLASTGLTGPVYDIRRTPNGQHVFVLLGDSNDGPFQRYSRTLAEEDEVAITDFYVDLQDFNVDDSYNVFRIADNVLYRYAADGTEVWNVDLNALYGYRWPTRLVFGSAYGSGQTVIVDGSVVRVCGYVGPADWTDGSEGIVLTLSRADGSFVSAKSYVTTGGNEGNQALAMSAFNDCLYVGGCADGTAAMGQTIAGVAGWLHKFRPEAGGGGVEIYEDE